MDKIKTIAITGIEGFLGSSLAQRLIKNYHVTGLVVNESKITRLDEKISSFPYSYQGVEKVFQQKVDVVIHTATDYGRKDFRLSELATKNLHLPLFILEKCIKKEITFINTDTVLPRLANEYSLSKKQFAEWLQFYAKTNKYINLELEHFYGAQSSNRNFIKAMLLRLLANEPEIDLTKGVQKRDFLYIDDVVDAFELIIKKIDHIPLGYSHFTIGSGTAVAIKDILLLMKKLTKSRSYLNFGAIPYRETELMKSEPDISAIKQLGWQPKISFEKGLKKMIESLK